jgi:copper chaperone
MKDQRDTTLAVQGMTCPACVRHVTEALQDLAGVGRIDVELRAGIVRVQHDAAAAPIDRLIAALREAGYDAEPRAG